MQKTETVHITKDLKERLKEFCKQNGLLQNNVAQKAIENELNRRENKR